MNHRESIAEKLRQFRLNELAKIVPRGENPPIHFCVCGKPARHEIGRNSGLVFVVPAVCGHHVYPVGQEPPERREMSYGELMRLRALCLEHAAATKRATRPQKLSVVERIERLEAAA